MRTDSSGSIVAGEQVLLVVRLTSLVGRLPAVAGGTEQGCRAGHKRS